MSTTETILEAVADIVGSDNVVSDESGREFFSADISFEAFELAAAVVQPASTEELAAIVERANADGFAVLARGGGMSYTQGYTPTSERTVLVDMRRMNKIREINTEDMYVVAEAGCTWHQMYETLAEHGVRTPYYGPLSGKFATVGGALSQNSVFWGGGTYATVADSALGLEVVLSGGRVLHTGSWARSGCNPFLRHNGPDLTGIFTGDTGAYGLKAAASIRLVNAPAVSLGASFGVADFATSTAAIAELSKYAIASEIYGLDPFYTDVMVRAGLEFLGEHPWSIHFSVDGPEESLAQAGLDLLRDIAAKHGTEIDNTTVNVFKSDPFGAVQSVLLGPEGELWLPIHAFLPFSRSQEAAAAIEGWFDELAPRLEEHNIKTSLLTAASGKDFLFEPSFYWFDELGDFRLEKIAPEAADEWKSIPADPETRSVVLDLRRQLAKRFDDLGCCHIQVGKYYEYGPLMEPETWKLTQGIKQLVDPDGLVNPGSLGL
ncbi:MAG: FAD-binding oxidoreductase [Gaiellaceae bacterium]